MTSPGNARIDYSAIASAIKRYKGDPAFAPGQTNAQGQLICGAKKRGRKNQGPGTPCQAAPVRGGTRCGNHGGKSPKAANAATNRIMEAEAVEILGRIDPTAEVKHPVEHLLNLINNKAAEVAWLRALVKDLNESELFYGLTKEERGEEKGEPTDLKTYEAGMHIKWQALRQAEEQLAKWTTMALRAGIEERKVRLAEEQGALVVGAIQQILDGLNLTKDQLQLVPNIVPAALRQLTQDPA